MNEDENISVSLSLYRANDGAEQAFRRVVAESKSELEKLVEESDLTLVDLDQLEDPNLGEESAALHMRASTEVLGTPIFFDSINVAFRHVNVIGSAVWFSSEKRVLLSDVVALARKQLERIN